MNLVAGVFLSLAAIVTAGSLDFKTRDDFHELQLDFASPLSEDRIIGGDEAQSGQFPYQVGLRMDYITSAGYCGGSLIDVNWVLTAAHCAVNVNFIDVYLGAHSIQDLNEDGRQNILVPHDNIIVHKDYNGAAISDDIALLKLPDAVQLSDAIQLISLPRYSEVELDFTDHYVTASGWGRNANNANGISPVLRFTEVRVQPQMICKHFFSNILPSNICTDTGLGRGTCNGDSGGPLAFQRRDRSKVIIGLTSFGSSIGCVMGFPSVFTRVTSYLDWIEHNSDIKILN